MKKILIAGLVPGMVLARDIFDNKGLLMIGKGTSLSNELINKLKKWEFNDVMIEEVAPSVKDEQEKMLIGQMSSEHKRVVNVAKTLMTEADTQNINPNLLKGMVGDLQSQIDLNTNVLLSLSNMQNYDNYLFTHVVNVAVLALLIGKQLRCF